ncbi:MAG: hypothetical protein M8840_02690 [marine benthic group bacterium]|nr:hypothetical protein [Gemmatimonadota bacterium]MCL7990021.1 hypothetical protein [Gemmatimonadota bacterium]
MTELTIDRRPRVPPWLAFSGVCLLLSILFYREFVFGPGTMLFGTDMVDQAFQLRQFGVEEIRSGRGFPLWNPFVYGGLPYLAVLPGPVFYPTSLLYLIMPLHRAIGWTFVLHTALSGVFAYAAARSIRLDPKASSAAGLAFLLTGMVLSTVYGGHDGRMFVMVLVPLAFALLEKGLQTGRAGWFAGMGLVVALQIFTPHVQLMYFSSLCLSLYALVRILSIGRGEAGRGGALRLFGLFGLGFLIAALVGAAQLVPTWRILDIAVRGGTGESGYGFASSWALPPQELTALILPDLVGSLQTYWGTNPFKLHTEYLGVVPVALALVALTGIRSDARVRLLSAIALLCILFALGAATPFHRLTYALVPLISRFRAPSMMLGPGALFVALLAGIGWERITAQPSGSEGNSRPSGAALAVLLGPLLLVGLLALASPEGLARWAHTALFPTGFDRFPGPEGIAQLRGNGMMVVLGTAAVFAVAWSSDRGGVMPLAAAALVACVLVADLWRVDTRYVETVRPEEVFPADPSIARMREGLGAGERVFPVPGRTGYRPNELMGYRVPSVTGSQNFRLEWFERLSGGLSYRNLGAPAVWQLFDLRYLTTDAPVETPLLTELERGARGVVYEVAFDAPHAWFPESVEATRDTSEALRRVLALEDPLSHAIVEADRAPPAGAGEARVTRLEADEIVLDVVAERSGLLFVSEIWHPSWLATVDGEPAEVLRTNVAFRGVVVPEGPHQVRLHYSAAEFRLGFGLSAAGLLLAGGVLLSGMAAWRRTGGDPGTEG